MNILLPTLLLALTACDSSGGGDTSTPDDTGSPADTGDTETGDTDTAPETGDTETGDTDETGDSGDTDDTADTGTVVEGDITITIDLAPRFAPEDLDELAAQLWYVDFAVGPGDPFAGARITGEVTPFDVPDPAVDTLTESEDYAGLYYGFFMIALVDDADDDGAWTAGETFVALEDTRFAVFIGGALTPEAQAEGYELGWFLFDLNTGASGAPEFTLPLNLANTGLAELGGTVSLANTDGAAIALGTVADGITPMIDQAFADPWTIPLPTTPPADHQTTIPEFDGLSLAGGSVVIYTDSDASGGYSAADEVTGGSCDGADVMAVAWFSAPTTLTQAAALTLIDMRAGWQVGIPASGGVLTLESDSAAATMDLSDSCLP